MQRKSLLTEFCPLAFATGRRPLQTEFLFSLNMQAQLQHCGVLHVIAQSIHALMMQYPFRFSVLFCKVRWSEVKAAYTKREFSLATAF